MVIELDTQKQAKEQKKLALIEEDKQYDVAQKAHLKLLDERELEKNRAIQSKLLQEKIQRDAQLKKMEHKRRKEARERLEGEVQLLNRLQSEMESERMVQLEKKRPEKEYFSKMLVENEKNLDLQKQLKEKERLEDVRAQEAYARMLDQQEQDRLNEIQAREQRAQAFMNRMADGVLAELDNIQKKEDDMITKYERQREMKLRREEEMKAKKMEKQKQQIIRTL